MKEAPFAALAAHTVGIKHLQTGTNNALPYDETQQAIAERTCARNPFRSSGECTETAGEGTTGAGAIGAGATGSGATGSGTTGAAATGAAAAGAAAAGVGATGAEATGTKATGAGRHGAEATGVDVEGAWLLSNVHRGDGTSEKIVCEQVDPMSEMVAITRCALLPLCCMRHFFCRTS